LNDYDVPLKRLQTDFAPVTLKLTGALCALKDHWERLLSTDQMRNDGMISITHQPTEMTIPPPQYVRRLCFRLPLCGVDVLCVLAALPGSLSNKAFG
jgi:hypothetical protein